MSAMLDVLDVLTYSAYLYAPPFIAVALAFLAGKLAWSLIPTPAPVRAIERVTGEAEGRAAPASAPAVRRLTALMPVSPKMRGHLALLHALGRYRSLTVEDLLALRLVGMGLGVVIALLGGKAATLFLGLALMVVGYMSPDMWLNGQAEKARRDLFRELPDAAENLAFLVGMGRPVNEALRRLAEGDTTMSKLIRAGLTSAPPGVSPVEHMATWVVRFDMPPLSQLFRRLAEIARRGVGERALLGDLAASAATQYETDLLRRAEQLDNKFTPVMGVFFLMPYIALIMLPFVFMLIRVMMGLR